MSGPIHSQRTQLSFSSAAPIETAMTGMLIWDVERQNSKWRAQGESWR